MQITAYLSPLPDAVICESSDGNFVGRLADCAAFFRSLTQPRRPSAKSQEAEKFESCRHVLHEINIALRSGQLPVAADLCRHGFDLLHTYCRLMNGESPLPPTWRHSGLLLDFFENLLGGFKESHVDLLPYLLPMARYVLLEMNKCTTQEDAVYVFNFLISLRLQRQPQLNERLANVAEEIIAEVAGGNQRPSQGLHHVLRFFPVVHHEFWVAGPCCRLVKRLFMPLYRRKDLYFRLSGAAHEITAFRIRHELRGLLALSVLVHERVAEVVVGQLLRLWPLHRHLKWMQVEEELAAISQRMGSVDKLLGFNLCLEEVPEKQFSECVTRVAAKVEAERRRSAGLSLQLKEKLF